MKHSLLILLLSVLMVNACGKSEADKETNNSEKTQSSLQAGYLLDKSAMQRVAEQIKEVGGENLRVMDVELDNSQYWFSRPNPDDPSEVQIFIYSIKDGWKGPQVWRGLTISGQGEPGSAENKAARTDFIEERLINFSDINLEVIPQYVQKFIDSAKFNGVIFTTDLVSVKVGGEAFGGGSSYYSLNASTLRNGRLESAEMELAKDGSVLDFKFSKPSTNN